MKKICVITGTRAEYGLFYPVMQEIVKSKDLELQLIATTMHLSTDYGNTYQCIEADGFKIDAKINNLKAGETNVLSYARLMQQLPKELERLSPDVVLLLGDRFETHAAATTALLMNIPIAHIHGGEITEGAVDEQLRHSITKMSYLHFTSTQAYADRVIQMGENPKNVIVSGAPGIDNISSLNLKSRQELEKEIDWKFGQKTALFTYHPETLSEKSAKQQIDEILVSIEKLQLNVLFTGANADKGGEIINQQIEIFVKSNPLKYKFIHNLGMLNYFTAMKNIDMLIGNSSSGIIEAASFNKPVIDIGDRQKGRLTSGNVIHSTIGEFSAKAKKLINSNSEKKQPTNANIYGVGKAAKKIVKVLEQHNLSILKKFHDM